MGHIKFILSLIIIIYIYYQYEQGNIDKSILGTLVGFGLLFEHHINRLIDVLNK